MISTPLDTDSVLQEAIQHHYAGRLADAEKLYRTILQSDPNHPDANHNLGVLAKNVGQLAAGLPFFKAALEANPESEAYWLSYIDALIHTDQSDAALEVIKLARQRGINTQKLSVLAAQLTAKPDAVECEQIVCSFNQGKWLEAERMARNMTCQFPNYPFGWETLAAALETQKKYAEANVTYRRALELVPESVMTLSNFAVCLNNQQCHEEALQCATRATELDPKSESAWVSLGLALQELQRLDEAKRVYEKALAYHPKSAKIINNLGILTQNNGFHEKAARLFRMAVEIAPDSTAFHYNLGTAFIQLGEVGAAKASFSKCIKIDPAYAPGYLGLSRIHIDQGEFEQAQAQINKALRVAPDSAAAWALLPSLRKMKLSDSAWLEKAKLLLNGDKLAKRDRMDLLYAIGKYFDDTNNYVEAFTHYRLANDLKKNNSQPYDQRNHCRRIDILTAAYHRDAVNKIWPGSSDSKRPLFIVGMPRSGTSLLEQILSSHAKIDGAGELRFWGQMVLKYPHETHAAQYPEDLLKKISAACLANLEKHSQNALRVLDKMPTNFHHLGFIHATFPHARILHTVRNPVDTCLSIYFQNFRESHDYANDLADLAHYYQEYRRLMDHWRSVLPKEVFLEVPYESLIDDPESWSRRIIDFVGLEWDENCLSFYQTQRRVGTSSNWQVRQPIYKTSQERWRNYEKFAGPLLPLLERYEPRKGQV